MRFQASAVAVLGLLAVLSYPPSAGKAQGSDQGAEVEKLDRELSAAGVRDDVDASSRLIADEAIFVWDLNQSGKIITKADNLASMKSPDYKLDSETFDEIHSKQFGDTVVIWGPQLPKARSTRNPFITAPISPTSGRSMTGSGSRCSLAQRLSPSRNSQLSGELADGR